MSPVRDDRNFVQVVIGLGVLTLGVLFTLDNVGVLEARDYLKYWPLALIGIGVAHIIQARTWSGYSGALMWMVGGLWFLGRNVGLIRVGLLDLLPLGLAVAGALLVFRGWRGYDAKRTRGTAAGSPTLPEIDDDGWVTTFPPAEPERPEPPPPPPPAPATQVPPSSAGAAPREIPRPLAPPVPTASRTGGMPGTSDRSDDHIVNAFVVMGGTTRRLSTLDFRGGTAVAVMGGVKVDLRSASIAQGDAVIDVLAFWGGIEIFVPHDWIVVSQVFPFMGGFDDRTGPKPAGSRKRLIVRGLAFMGGVEVKH